jgi:hypothetical protein
MYSIPLWFFIQKLSTVLFALCHFVGLKVLALFPKNSGTKYQDRLFRLKKNSGNKIENNFVGLNIFLA